MATPDKFYLSKLVSMRSRNETTYLLQLGERENKKNAPLRSDQCNDCWTPEQENKRIDQNVLPIKKLLLPSPQEKWSFSEMQ